MRLKNVCAAAVLSAGIVLTPASAQAEVIDFSGVGRSSIVSLSGLFNGSVRAGELNWAFVGTAPEGFAQTFYSYCADLLNYLQDPQTVSVGSTDSLSGAQVAANGGGKAAWLFNTFAASIHSLTGSAANLQAAALQVAIWEALYDTTNNLSTGNIRLNTTGAIVTQATAYLSALHYAPNSYHTATATLLSAASGQSQITARVSEPSTILLLGFGLFMFGTWMRRPAAGNLGQVPPVR